jgi:hypothetical protein
VNLPESDGHERNAASATDVLAEAEINFLNASVAVWREIDKHTVEGVYVGWVPEQLTRGSDLRVTERLAWERYRDLLAGVARGR